jgi:hypothetical protein
MEKIGPLHEQTFVDFAEFSAWCGERFKDNVGGLFLLVKRDVDSDSVTAKATARHFVLGEIEENLVKTMRVTLPTAEKIFLLAKKKLIIIERIGESGPYVRDIRFCTLEAKELLLMRTLVADSDEYHSEQRVGRYELFIGDAEVAQALDEIVASDQELLAIRLALVEKFGRAFFGSVGSRRLDGLCKAKIDAFVETMNRLIFGPRPDQLPSGAINQCIEGLASYGVQEGQIALLCLPRLIADLRQAMAAVAAKRR